MGSGTGYIYIDDHIKYITWSEANDLEIPANSNTSIYVDETGEVKTISGTGVVSFFTQIFLGRVATNATDIVFLNDSYRDAVTMSTKYDRLFRLYLGAVFRAGCITSANNLNLNVTSGDWALSGYRFQPSGGTSVTFSTWYRDGSSWYNILDGQTDVPNGHYDNGTGSLQSLTDAHYVKHAFYTYGQ